MDNAIAWPTLIAGVIAALGSVTVVVYLRSQGRHRSPREGSGLAPLAYLVLVLVMLAGVLLALWALNLGGTLGR